ncbi:MAG: inner membrane CreD family protein [Sandaracinaceae bacterium]
MGRIFGIGVVWAGCAIAWVVLGGTLLARSESANSMGSSDVYGLWGPPTEQGQPHATFTATRMVDDSRTITDPATGQVTTIPQQRAEQYTGPIELVGTDAHVDLSLEHRRRGLNWYPTYRVELEGTWRFRNDTPEPRQVTFEFPLSEQQAVFDGFEVRRGGQEVPYEINGAAAIWTETLAAGEERAYHIGYRSRGTERWGYRFANGTSRTRDFHLDVTTDFAEVDFAEGSLSPTDHAAEGEGWHGVWSFDSLIANQPIGIVLPQRLNPGPLAARITFFAPVGLLFFFFVVGILGMADKRDLHPMHYFFLGCAFFAFHLLFSYLVDHLEIAASFSIAAVVSTVLVASYARLFVGWRFALGRVGVAQLIYLVLFSLTFMWEGFTGLSITVGAILTLFVMMQITGRTAWGKKTEAPAPPLVANPPAPTAVTLDGEPKAF